MGLLDFLPSGSQGGYGGLLDSLMYPSPLTQKDNYATNEFDSQFLPQRPDPFGPPPQMAQWAQQFAPPSPFNGTAPAAPTQFAAGPTMQPQAAAPALSPQQPQEAAPQVNDLQIGGYSMPRMGSAADFTPQASDFSAQSRSPQMAPEGPQPPMQAQQQLPPAIGGRADSVLGRIGHPDGLIARLTGNDSRSVAQQNLKAQYDALVPLVGQQKAMLAVLNPEAGKTILAQALEKKQYGFTKLDNDTIVNQDPQTGKVNVAYSSDKGSSIQGPDGKMIEMPQGADPKTWRNEITRINADVAAGKKTEVQAKSEIFANKMEQSNKSITDGVGTSLAGKVASGLPLGNYVQTPEYQKYKQASSNFITALLRQESGAAISKSEFDRYDKEYMPQPGDGPDVLAQKTEARRIAIEGMKKGAGPGYKSPTASPLPSGWSVSVR